MAPSSSIATPLRIQIDEMYGLAVISILEGSHDLIKFDTHDQLMVAAVIVNRLHSKNWVLKDRDHRGFGPGIFDQIFGKGQFEVTWKHGLTRESFDSLDGAATVLRKAKKSAFSQCWAEHLIFQFIRAVGDPKEYGAAVSEVGNNTGFRGNNPDTKNRFRQESKDHDPSDLQSKQPSSITTKDPLFPLFPLEDHLKRMNRMATCKP